MYKDVPNVPMMRCRADHRLIIELTQLNPQIQIIQVINTRSATMRPGTPVPSLQNPAMMRPTGQNHIAPSLPLRPAFPSPAQQQDRPSRKPRPTLILDDGASVDRPSTVRPAGTRVTARIRTRPLPRVSDSHQPQTGTLATPRPRHAPSIPEPMLRWGDCAYAGLPPIPGPPRPSVPRRIRTLPLPRPYIARRPHAGIPTAPGHLRPQPSRHVSFLTEPSNSEPDITTIYFYPESILSPISPSSQNSSHDSLTLSLDPLSPLSPLNLSRSTTKDLFEPPNLRTQTNRLSTISIFPLSTPLTLPKIILKPDSLPPSRLRHIIDATRSTPVEIELRALPHSSFIARPETVHIRPHSHQHLHKPLLDLIEPHIRFTQILGSSQHKSLPALPTLNELEAGERWVWEEIGRDAQKVWLDSPTNHVENLRRNMQDRLTTISKLVLRTITHLASIFKFDSNNNSHLWPGDRAVYASTDEERQHSNSADIFSQEDIQCHLRVLRLSETFDTKIRDANGGLITEQVIWKNMGREAEARILAHRSKNGGAGSHGWWMGLARSLELVKEEVLIWPEEVWGWIAARRCVSSVAMASLVVMLVVGFVLSVGVIAGSGS